MKKSERGMNYRQGWTPKKRELPNRPDLERGSQSPWLVEDEMLLDLERLARRLI